MNRKLIAMVVVASAMAPVWAARLPLSETLIELKADYRPSWTSWKLQPWTAGDDSLVLTSTTNKDVSVRVGGTMRGTRIYFPDYCPAGRAKVSFEYRTTAEKGAGVGFGFCPMIKHETKGWNKPLPKAADWTRFEDTFEFPTWEPYEGGLSFNVPKGGQTLEVRKLRVVELPPENDTGREFLIGGDPARGRAGYEGVPATEIALVKTDDEMTIRNERRAAMMIRYALVKTGHRYLPIVEYDDVPSVKAGMICVGRAAEGTGLFSNDFFTDDQLKTIRGKEGTGAYAVKGGAAGVTGNCPGGPQYGAFRFLNRAGIEYVATDLFHCEPTALADTVYVHTPAITYRAAMSRSGAHVDLRGFTSDKEIVGNLSVGAGDASAESWGVSTDLSHDSLGFIVSMPEFEKTHPEFFALQADGTRMDSKRFLKGHTQFCWSNPELKKEVARRYVDIMRGNPGAKLFCFAPGDGGGWECKCENCKKRGATSTALVELMNEVGRETGKVFPDKRIFTYSYATTLEAPAVDYVDPHVKFTDSIYCNSHWPASEWFDHPANARGLKALADWRKVVPDMGVMMYYEYCGNPMEVWPAFWGWVKTERNFAEHGGYYLDRTYSHTTHANGYLPNNQLCGDAAYYILPRVETDPTYDVEAGLAHWFPLFYGPAAKDMRAAFDRANKELVDRDWVQNCEIDRRGFVTPAFANDMLAILDRAAKAAEGDERIATLVRHERGRILYNYIRDNCRGRGNLPASEFPTWAKRVAEFIQIARTTPGTTYFGYRNIRKDFKNSFFYDLKQTHWDWLREPQLDKIIADPVKELDGSLPAKQEKTAKGWRIPVDGMVGGEFHGKIDWCVPKGEEPFLARVLRREPTGYGLILTQLKLDAAPTNAVTLRIRGNDNDKKDVALMAIEINGKTIFSGKVSYPKDGWSYATYAVPAGVLKAGVNDIVVRNVTPDPKPTAECGIAFQSPADPYWGWVYLADFDFEFAK